MSRSWQRHALAGALLLLAGCNSDLISPLRPLDPLAAARAAAAYQLYAYVQSAQSIALSWIDVSRNETGWEVHRSTAGPAGPFTLLASLPVNSVNHVDGSLTARTEYCYRVRSFRSKGPNVTTADFSDVVCATTYAAPAAPSALSAFPSNSATVQVGWTDNATDETGIRLERASSADGPWTGLANLPPNTTAFTDYGRPSEQAACYRVTAVGTYGTSPSVTDCTVPPAAPANVAASTTGTSAIDVTWTDASAAEDGYQVERALEGSSFAVVANLPAGASSYHDAAITPDQRYLYIVRATRDGGFSSYSNSAAGMTVTGPPATPGLQVYPAGSTTAWVHWGVSATTTSVRIERSADGLSGWEQVATVNLSDAESFYDADRVPEVRVCYRVFAANAFGESAASNVDCTVPLAQPTNLAVVQNEDQGYTATWTDNSSHEEGYLVTMYYCYPGYYCEWYYEAWLEANATGITTLEYEYPMEVRACGDGGCSDLATASTLGAGVTAAPSAIRSSRPAPQDFRKRIRDARRKR